MRDLTTKELDLIFDPEKVGEEDGLCDRCNQPISEHDDGECPKLIYTDVRKEESYIDVNFKYLNSLLNFFKI